MKSIVQSTKVSYYKVQNVELWQSQGMIVFKIKSLIYERRITFRYADVYT
jgi:hypothetical protein